MLMSPSTPAQARRRPLKEAEALQLVGHFPGHVAGVALRQVRRHVPGVEIAPALERPAGARRGRDDRPLDLDPAVLVSFFLVEVLVEADELLSTADDAAHHP